MTEFNVIAWFAPEGIEREEDGQRVFIRKCRVCQKEITKGSIIVRETATPEQIARALADGKRDGQAFFEHLYVDHHEYFEDDGPASGFDPEFLGSFSGDNN